MYDLRAKRDPVRRLTETQAYETDAKFSPQSRYVSFIRDQDLFVIDLRSGKESALTSDGEGLVQNGVAEFIAGDGHALRLLLPRRSGGGWVALVGGRMPTSPLATPLPIDAST